MARVGARLAVQTVALVIVLLLVLELVVYLVTQQTLLDSLRSTLEQRGNPPLSFVRGTFHLGDHMSDGQNAPSNAPVHGSSPGPGPGPPPGPNPDEFPSDVSSVFIDAHLHIVHSDGALGNVMLNRSAVRAALITGKTQCCGVSRYKRVKYLVYTNPLRVEGKIIGVDQASISEQQYSATLDSLLHALLIVALLGLLGAAGVSYALVHRALQPIRVSLQRQQDFVADAAHELRTPLAIQRTVGEVGMGDVTLDDLQTTIGEMLGENQHLTHLVDDLSLLARSDTGAIVIDREVLNFSELVRETARELRWSAEENGVVLDVDVAPDIEVRGDELRLRQLLLILLDNAFKHSPPEAEVKVRLDASGGRARLEVEDAGSGIEVKDLGHIFDRFYRAEYSRASEGTGLGLAIAKWIVEAHDGQIRAENRQPHGALFTVQVPLAHAHSAA